MSKCEIFDILFQNIRQWRRETFLLRFGIVIIKLFPCRQRILVIFTAVSPRTMQPLRQRPVTQLGPILGIRITNNTPLITIIGMMR